MTKTFFEWMLSEDSLDVSFNALIVFTLLYGDVESGTTETAKLCRKKGNLASGLSVQSIALKTRFSHLEVKRLLDELRLKGYVKLLRIDRSIVYDIGSINGHGREFYFDSRSSVVKKKEITITDQIRKLVKEKKERDKSAREAKRIKLSPEAKRTVGAEVFSELEKSDKASSKIIRYYKKAFVAKYKKEPESLLAGPYGKPPGKIYVFAGRLFEFTGSRLEECYDHIDYVIRNWEVMKERTEFYGDPTFNLICTKGFYEAVKKFRMFGLPKKKGEAVAKRSDKKSIDSEPDVGW